MTIWALVTSQGSIVMFSRSREGAEEAREAILAGAPDLAGYVSVRPLHFQGGGAAPREAALSAV